MKHYFLKAIVKQLQDTVHSIKMIKRVDNNTISIEFNDKKTYYFDLSKGNSYVYKKHSRANAKKEFNAPFDTLLQKRFINSKIKKIDLHQDDKIIRIYVDSKSSYKNLRTILQLEFTGKHTNIIILDEDENILEALRHIDAHSSSRVVKVGEKLEDVPKQNFIFEKKEIEDIDNILYELYENKEAQEIKQIKKQKSLQIEKNLRKISALISSLPLKQDLEEESQRLYEKGNLVLNNLHLIKPYQQNITVYDYEGNEKVLELETKQNPSIYANELFKKAKKAKKKSENVGIEKDNLEQKQEYFQRLLKNIQQSESIDDVEFLLPKRQKNQTKTKKSKPYESFFFQGYNIYLGSNEASNIYLLQNSKASDFWFHLKDINSCHVIVQNTKKTLPIDVIYKAAYLCAQFSTDFSGKYLVDFTQRRNVKVKNAANVLYNPYDTIDVHLK